MIKEKIEGIVEKAVVNLLRKSTLGKRESVPMGVFASENGQFGHYSTNASLKLAKNLKKNSLEIAKKICSSSIVQSSKLFSRVEIAPPGFINFWLKPEVFQNEVKEILKRKEKYGRLKPKTLVLPAGRQNLKSIQIEYVSANPTGPLTLANGRGGFFGDVLANILEFRGSKIEREYYVNDTGNQIVVLGKSLAAAEGLIPYEENFYQGDYVKKWAKKNRLAIKKHKNDYLKLGQLAAKDFLASIKKVLIKDSGIRFTRFISESRHIHKKSFVKKVLAIFKKSGLTYEKDGALWLKTTRFGDDKDRVLVTGDGFPTYFLADAGHYLETKERGFGGKINIMGPDHYGYVKRIQAAAEIIGFKNSEIIITQAIRLVRKGKEVKMSKRKGEFVAFSDLVAEVGVDAARFSFLMHSPESHMDFDLSLAKERSMKNPVYYVQYAGVRAQSILQKAKGFVSGGKEQRAKVNFDLLNTPEDINLMRTLARFPEIIEEAAKKRSPQTLTRYSMDLAREFHNFYEKERVIGEEKEVVSARLCLIQATLIVFKNIFGLLGIGLPREM